MSSSSLSFHAIPDFFSPFPPSDPCRPPLEHQSQWHRHSHPPLSFLLHRLPSSLPGSPLSEHCRPPCFLVAAGYMLSPTTFPDHRRRPPPGPRPQHRCLVHPHRRVFSSPPPTTALPPASALSFGLPSSSPSGAAPPLAKLLSPLPLLANLDIALARAVLSCHRRRKLRCRPAPSGTITSSWPAPPCQTCLLLSSHYHSWLLHALAEFRLFSLAACRRRNRPGIGRLEQLRSCLRML